jgi:predicted  nucleic acid-binding Zn-ribbon protein
MSLPATGFPLFHSIWQPEGPRLEPRLHEHKDALNDPQSEFQRLSKELKKLGKEIASENSKIKSDQTTVTDAKKKLAFDEKHDKAEVATDKKDLKADKQKLQNAEQTLALLKDQRAFMQAFQTLEKALNDDRQELHEYHRQDGQAFRNTLRSEE